MDDLKDRGAKIIIGDFYEDVARKVNINVDTISNVLSNLPNIMSGNVSSFQVWDDPEAGLRVAAAGLVQRPLVRCGQSQTEEIQNW